MKKLLVGAASVGLFLSAVLPALATGGFYPHRGDLTVVNNSSEASAVSGSNAVGNVAQVDRSFVHEVEVSGSNFASIKSGTAYADSKAGVVLNTCTMCDLFSRGGKTLFVDNSSYAGAVSGNNSVGNVASVVKSGVYGEVEVRGNNFGMIHTDGSTAYSNAWVMVNPTMWHVQN